MRLQTVVQHHPSRAPLLPALLAAIPPDAQVITDPGGPRRDAWRCYQACLEALDLDADWLLVVQDDIRPCRDFAAAAPAVVAAHAARRPEQPLALFVPGIGGMRRRVLAACAAGERFCELDPLSWVPVVALAWPAALIPRILAHAEQRQWPSTATSDDANIAEALKALGAVAWGCVPSLVEHPDEAVSVMGRAHSYGRNPARTAACWTGPDIDALSLEWC